jgi:integrase
MTVVPEPDLCAIIREYGCVQGPNRNNEKIKDDVHGSFGAGREIAAELRTLVAEKIDPVAWRRQQDRAREIEGRTFSNVVDQYETEFASRAGIRAIVFLARRHAKGLLDLPIAQVTVADVRKALAGIQATYPKTAKRTLAATATVFDYAKAMDLRAGDNPASWQTFRFLWPPPPMRQHMRAMAFADVPVFYQRLIVRGSTTSLALAFLILTATRSNETIRGRRAYVDVAARLWVIPTERMKARKEHRIPLSDAAMAILDAVRQRHPDFDYLFPASHGGQMANRILEGLLHRHMGVIDASVHGFRSSFSTAMHETTGFAHEDIELCLAHQIGNDVSQSYNRATAVEKRRVIMQHWADLVTGKTAATNVVALRRPLGGGDHRSS